MKKGRLVMGDIYRGWPITATTIASQMAQAGLLIYGFSALALPLEQEFGTSRTQVMIAATCLSLSSSAFAPIAGSLVDRKSVKWLMLFGAAALALGFTSMSVAQSIWHIWLVYALIVPFANVLLGQISSSTLITRWFERRRGRAMGLSSLGTSLGGFVFPVLIATLNQSHGWRIAALTCGLATAGLLALLILLIVRDRPDEDDTTERVHGLSQARAKSSDGVLTTFQVLALPAFWIITFAVGLKIATYFSLINNLAGFAEEIGIGAVVAASMVSVLSLTSMVGKLSFGTLSEKLSPRTLMVTALSMTVASFALLLIVDSVTMLIVACLLLGLSTGGMLPLWSLVIAQQFGDKSFGKVLGLTNLAMVPLTASASPLAGLSHDATGSYRMAIWGALIALTIAAALAAMLRGPQKGAEET